MSTLRIETPRAFKSLLQPARYKGAHGGRGSAKSHFFAELLIERCYWQKTRAACIREVQNSLKESVRQLLVDKIAKFGLQDSFEVLESEIRCPHGGLIIFRGMQSYNAETIKSLEGYDVAWVEEAQTLSERSLRMLRPTIRAEGSEIWFSWNPRNETDAVDEFLRGPTRHPDAIVVEVNWRDNPWFPDVLKQEMQHDRATDPEMATHVWDGGYEILTEGSYYGRMIAQAESEGRIGDFPFDPDLPVLTGWDIGVDDYTAVWFIQENGRQARAIDYYETSGLGAEQIVRECMPEMLPDADEREFWLAEIGRARPYTYGSHYFPHDVMVREWGGGAKTRFQTMTELGLKQIHAGAQQRPEERINAARRLLPAVSFHKERTSLGIKRLRHYRRRRNESLGVYTGPVHDEASHCADAFGEFAVNCRIAPKPQEAPSKPRDRWDAVFGGDREDDSWRTA